MKVIAGSLNDWTTDQLLAEVLKRNGQDAGALRLMQDITLRARLTEHDRAPPTAHR